MDNFLDGAKLSISIFNTFMAEDLIKFGFYFLIGAIGALTKDVFEDNALTLPKTIEGKLILGSIGGAFVGGISGYLVDGSLLSAFAAGYAGKSIIENLLAKINITPQITKAAQPPASEPVKISIEELIRRIAKEECVDPELAVRVAKCESGLNPNARNVNTTGSVDRGLYQWNDKYHPEITDAMAYDPEIACREFCKAIKVGHLSWWDASKACWNR